MIRSISVLASALPKSPSPPMPYVHRGMDGRSYAVIDGRSIWLDSEEFRRIVRYRLLFRNNVFATNGQQKLYIERLKALAHSSPIESVHVRVCDAGDSIFIDLANSSGHFVKIDNTGVSLLQDCPVRFARPKGIESLPEPVGNGDHEQLRSFVRLSDNAFRLFVAQLTYMFRDGPQPLMAFVSEQGRGKTTVAKMVQKLVDPRSPAIRQLPASRRDLMIAARHAWLLNFDNISELKPCLSDALCTLSTGGGYGVRTSHSDEDETIFVSLRPVVLGGIGNFVTRDDLRDRCIFYELEPILNEHRRPEAALWRDFNSIVPQILGGLYHLCSRALTIVGTLTPKELPRMADFYIWALAVEAAAGWPEGSIDVAYRDQRASSDADAMEADLVLAIGALLSDSATWEGTASEMLDRLRAIPSCRNLVLPRCAATLGAELHRIAQLLRRNGLAVERSRTGASRRTTLRRIEPSLSSVPSPFVGAGQRAASDESQSIESSDYKTLGEAHVSDFRPVSERVDLSGFLVDTGSKPNQ